MSENETENTGSGLNVDDFFGKPKSGGADYKWHTITEEGPNTFRIAPPVKSMRTTGQFYTFAGLHYGYTVPDQNDADKTRSKPFLCIEKKNRANDMVEQDCPECAFLEAQEKRYEQIQKEAVNKGKTEAQAAELVAAAKKLEGKHNLDRKYYVLAKNLAGEWGVLKLPIKVFKELRSQMDRYIKQNDGEHPLNPHTGVWFEFTREGQKLQTSYTVKIAQESAGKGLWRNRDGALTAVDVEALKVCPDLATLFDGKKLNYDQIRALVASNNDPVIVATVFNAGTRRSESSPAPAPQKPAAPKAAAPKAPEPTPEPENEGDELAKLRAQLAAAEAKVAAATKEAAPKAAAPKAPAKVVNEEDLLKMTPEDFLKEFKQ